MGERWNSDQTEMTKLQCNGRKEERQKREGKEQKREKEHERGLKGPRRRADVQIERLGRKHGKTHTRKKQWTNSRSVPRTGGRWKALSSMTNSER